MREETQAKRKVVPESNPSLRIAASDTLTSAPEITERGAVTPEAFGKLYELHYSSILNYIYRRMLDVHLAEELTSNTFFSALRALPKYSPKAPFRAWLYRIATNEIRMHWRSRKTRERNDPLREEQLRRVYFASPETQTPEEVEEKMRRFKRLHDSLLALPHRYQTVLVLKYFEKLPYNEIAQVLQKKEGTIKSLIHRGLKRLKRIMVQHDATFS